MIIYPNAKINLGLNVVEKRPDGYHNLETVFYPIPLQDAIEITAVDNEKQTEENVDYRLKVTGNLLDGTPDDNLVIKAYRLLRNDFDIAPCAFNVFKHIPTGAGLGGGSSDAAFTIKALNDRFGLGLTDTQMEKYAARLGADCAFFIRNKPVMATGIGNVFSPIDLSLKGKTLVLVKPDIFVSTPDAYRLVKPHKPEQSLAELLKQPIETWKDNVKNDFEVSVFAKYPEIAGIKDMLYDLGAVYASMSGSGSCVFGIFDQPLEHVDDSFAGYFCRQRELE
ncbi:MAG: 4-(cytidine 5'-diphospho)-2-C-methyl-D-erythritol kinase [Bacteroidaceae bacterium]|nr:4-(cytidine 5'-diphospho)-2-C-methyl-D-erythritol kinase [Bacteroidaceae bacterium]